VREEERIIGVEVGGWWRRGRCVGSCRRGTLLGSGGGLNGGVSEGGVRGEKRCGGGE